MKIGFTGTRDGMTEKQKDRFTQLLQETDVEEFHHGDCFGADAEAHALVKGILDSHIVIHPPIKGDYRAGCEGSEMLPAKHYLDRNRDIVDATDLLVAVPKGADNYLRSGTWATVRYARRQKRPILIILPDGKVVRESNGTFVRK